MVEAAAARGPRRMALVVAAQPDDRDVDGVVRAPLRVAVAAERSRKSGGGGGSLPPGGGTPPPGGKKHPQAAVNTPWAGGADPYSGPGEEGEPAAPDPGAQTTTTAPLVIDSASAIALDQEVT